MILEQTEHGRVGDATGLSTGAEVLVLPVHCLVFPDQLQEFGPQKSLQMPPDVLSAWLHSQPGVGGLVTGVLDGFQEG